ncbi:MAG TPA: S9 family peptidase [Vicinamibacteria bacterium]|nr:S9 family peptidase [Vicinamibacteria bacterium]
MGSAGLAACVLLLALWPAALRGGERPSLDSLGDALGRVRMFRQCALSPDGEWVAWVEGMEGEGLGGPSTIHLGPRGGGPIRTISGATDGRPHHERGVRFSPDSRTLAFLSDAGHAGQLQLYLAPVAGGPSRVLSHVSGQLDDPSWSPEGRRLAVLYVAGSTQPGGARVPYKPDAGEVEERIDEQRIALVDVDTGALREVSPPDLYVYDYDWSPDGRRLVAEAARGSGTNNYWTAELFLIAADSGQTRSIWKPPLQIAVPRFSPDGGSVAVIHGLMSDEGVNGGDVFSVPVGGGEPKNLTPDLAASATWLGWGPGSEIVFTAHADGGFAVGRVPPGKPATLVWQGPEVLSSPSVDRAGRMALVRQSFSLPPEVWAGEPGRWTAVTHANGGATPLWGEAKSLHWESDGLRVQGWLIAPREVEPGRSYPLVVSVHGGPSGAASPSWPVRWTAVLPAQGYYVFLPNPRGSYGQGEAFTRANVKDFGHGDLRDVLRGVEAVLRAAPIDARRLGIIGWSYGGYMAMWAVTQTDRFKAAVAGAGIANWQSYYGQNRIDRWMLPFFGASVYDDPAVYARSSPITFIKNVRTPTLVLHGDRDSEVPTPQGYEFWHALKTLGVPTQLVIFENEGHAISKPEHKRDLLSRVVSWFDRYLGS